MPPTGAAPAAAPAVTGATGVGGSGGAGALAVADPEVGGRIIERVRREVGDAQFDRYFGLESTLRVKAGGVEVAVPSGFMASLYDRRFGLALRRAASAELRTEDARVAFVVGAPEASPAPAAACPDARRAAVPRVDAESRGGPAPLSPRFRLEAFVVGASNGVAYDAALAIADGRADAPPVLVLHGACGAGKTHLLQGIVLRARVGRGAPACRVVTGEAFANEFLGSLRGRSVDRFRRLYRGLDLLCVDDVQCLATKQATQTELQHTIDAIRARGGRVVLSADAPPREIARFGMALVSRLQAGAVVRLDPPDPALWERLVRHHASARSLVLEPAAVQHLVSRCTSPLPVAAGAAAMPTVRDLEGWLATIDAAARVLPDLCLADGGVGLLGVQRALGVRPGPTGSTGTALPRRPVRAEHIAAVVSGELGVPVEALLGRSRAPRVVLARSMSAYLARELSGQSYPEIARALGRPSHSTVIAAVRRVERLLRAKAPAPGAHGTPGLTIDVLCTRLREAVLTTRAGSAAAV